jgi:hypothetical protein
MKREEATGLLKEIAFACEQIGENGIILMRSSANEAQSNGYQLHLKSSIDKQSLVCIQNIAKKHNLTVNNKPEDNLIVIC